MPPKTIRSALANMLENLKEENFKKFCRQLLDREEVTRRQVEGKDYLDIADVLVSAFTEARSHLVAVELLKEINCKQEATKLESVIAGLSSKPDSGRAAGPTGGAAGETMAEEKHFVDKHKLQLIQRVANTSPILDELLEEGVIQQESYDEIRALPTSQGRMRELYSGCLKAGTASKDVFYKSLEKNNKYLIEDLKKNC